MNVAVVPAAGRSSRLGRSKALLPFRRARVVDAVAGSLRAGGVDRVVVVAAGGDLALVRHCARGGLTTAVNEHPEAGMLSSLLCGVRALARDLRGGGSITFCPVDHPGLRPATVRALLAEAARSPAPLVAPTLGGRRGHPLVVDAALAPALETLDPDVGLRGLFERYPCSEVEVDDDAVRRDLDTWSDYLQLLRDSAADAGAPR